MAVMSDKTCSLCSSDPGLLHHAHLTITRDAWTEKNAEIDALRAENERLRETLKWAQEVDQRHVETTLDLRAEIERLRAEIGQWRGDWLTMQAENEQLPADMRELNGAEEVGPDVSEDWGVPDARA